VHLGYEVHGWGVLAVHQGHEVRGETPSICSVVVEGSRVALEWGVAGARSLVDGTADDVIVVVDVLSFSTSVVLACEKGATVWPHPGGEEAHALARSLEAVLAGSRTHREGPSLSPSSMLDLPEGTRLVLPSPNGSAITHALRGTPCAVVAGCLRNASAVARFVQGFRRVLLVPGGERWGDGSLRFAYEDLVGAGGVASKLVALSLSVELTPEAQVARLAFEHRQPLSLTPSGIELADRDFTADVELASQVDASTTVPVLRDGHFQAA
jgi:2-phosphosulfolactate phosphatase